jgi:surfeit locus 1 family protein
MAAGAFNTARIGMQIRIDPVVAPGLEQPCRPRADAPVRQTRFRRLLVPSVTTALMLVITVWLGIWQLHRLAWKTALLAQIDVAERAPGITLPTDPSPFQKVRVTGRLDRDGRSGLYGVEVRDLPSGPMLGSQLVVLLDPAQGGPPIVTLLGWLPSNEQPPAEPAGLVTIEGYVRPAEHAGLFSAQDDLATRRFYSLDPAVIGPALGAAAVAPFSLVRMGTPQPGVYPQPTTALPRPPNDHLQYAVTWFGLAATLVVVFCVYARKALAA